MNEKKNLVVTQKNPEVGQRLEGYTLVHGVPTPIRTSRIREIKTLIKPVSDIAGRGLFLVTTRNSIYKVQVLD